MGSDLTSRERILTALDGREPDRAGCALSSYHVDLDALGLQSRGWSDIVDVDFVSSPVTADEEALRRLAEPHPPDTRLGTPVQVATYARWRYRPHDAQRTNPLARARSLADLHAFPFPDVVPFTDGDSDGFFEPIVADLVEIGVNAINPLQPEYREPVRIRRTFGPRLALWGTVGRQTTFAFAQPDQIRQEVRKRVQTLGRAGLVLCPAYDIDEPDIPAENIEAFLDAVRMLA